MFRDLKEYQEIAKIYADKVSKPENLEENQANRMKMVKQRTAQNAGRAAKQFGFLKAKPIVRKPGATSVRTRGGGAPQVEKPQPKPAAPQAAAPAPTPTQQAAPAPQAKPQVSNLTKQGKPRTKAQMMAAKRIASGKSIDDVKAANTASMKSRAAERNQKFQAAKKSGNLAQFRKDNPKMSGADRAKAMAKARLAAKNKPTATPEKSAAPAPQAQQKATATPSGDKLKAGSFGISAKGKEQAAKNRAEVANKKQTSNTSALNVSATKKPAPEIKKFPGSGKEIPSGSKVTQTTSTNDKGQKVTTTTATRSGNEVPADIKNKIRQRRGLPPIESGNTSTKKITQGEGGGTENLTKSAGSLEANKKKAEKLKQDAAKRAAMEKEFEFESNQFDAYDLVLEYLLSSEQVATIEEANYVMTEMDAETIQGIVEEQKEKLEEGLPLLAKGAAIVGGAVLAKKGLDKAKQSFDNYLNKQRDKGIGGNTRPGSDKMYYGDKKKK